MERLHPRAVWLFFIGSLSGWIFLFFILFFVLFFLLALGDFETLLFGILKFWYLILIFLIIFAYFVARLNYHFYRYELTHEVFRKESGIIWKHYVSIPYTRIQNVDISRGLWARILGLSDIQIHTAGVGGVAFGEGHLPGLSKEEAEHLREILIKKVGYRGQGL